MKKKPLILWGIFTKLMSSLGNFGGNICNGGLVFMTYSDLLEP